MVQAFKRAISLLTVTCLISSQVIPQQVSMSQVLSGSEAYPSTVLASDIKPAWKAVRIGVSQSSGGGLMDMLFGMMGSMFGAMSGGGGNSGMQMMVVGAMSWTDGTTVKMNNDEFILTYKLDIDMAAFENPEKAPDFTKVPLRLTLINTKSISSLTPLPEMTKEKYIAALQKMNESQTGTPAIPDSPDAPVTVPAENVGSARTQTLSNVKQLALATVMYCADYDDVAPYAQSTSTVKYVTGPYLKNFSVWNTMNPNGGKFLFNMALAGASLGDVENPAETVLFYESEAWPDGSRVVAFVDGHAKVLASDQWEEYKQSLKLKIPKRTKPLPANYGFEDLKRMGQFP